MRVSSVRVVWVDCLHFFMNAGAKYEAVKIESRLDDDQREVISGDLDTEAPPAPAPAPPAAATAAPAPSLDGRPSRALRMAILRR